MQLLPEGALKALRRAKKRWSTRTFAALDLGHTIGSPQTVSHARWQSFLSAAFNKPGMRILEIGSRNVTGTSSKRFFDAAEHVGFDFYPGENVDLVGDAHRLASYFRDDERFDLVFSSAVFEHLYMPWVVAEQIAHLLKVGGHVMVETHFAFAAHERPWHFFHFSDMGLRALFNPALGFEVIDAGMSNPINGVFADAADPYLRGKRIPEMYCHSELFCRKTRDVPGFVWKDVAMDEIVGATRYPTT